MSPLRVHERPLDARLDPFAAYRALRGNGLAVLLDAPPGIDPDAPTWSGGDAGGAVATVLFDPFETLRALPGAPDPFAALFAALARCGRTEGPPGRPRGAAAGFLAYDLGRVLERLPDTARRDHREPDLLFGLFNRGVEIDARSGDARAFVVEVPSAGRAGAAYVERSFAELRERLAAPATPPGAACAGVLRSNFHAASYAAAVERVRALILDGEVYQVNLAQRFEATFEGDPDAVYARLRAANPAPYAARVDGPEVRVLSSSPELFLRLEGDRVETRPIKGTRPRTGAKDADARARADLESAEKDGAELAMIVDLLRNDLGRVAAFGSVDVVEAARTEEFATVFHRTATVRARLREGLCAEDLLRAAFPGGSVTGAPKIRAMEVIEDLEAVRRGVFTGAIGWIGFQGDLCLNVAIRTLVCDLERVRFHAGGGVVIDSDPAAEYLESLAKARALAAALGAALPGPTPAR